MSLRRNLAAEDVLPITDVSASETKKIKAGNLIKDGIDNLPNNSIPGDKVEFTNIDGAAILDGTIDGEQKLKSICNNREADELSPTTKSSASTVQINRWNGH